VSARYRLWTGQSIGPAVRQERRGSVFELINKYFRKRPAKQIKHKLVEDLSRLQKGESMDKQADLQNEGWGTKRESGVGNGDGVVKGWYRRTE
jgi:hypothetical protein